MKNTLHKILFLLLIGVASISTSFAQNADSKGKDFWLMFNTNSGGGSLQLFITSGVNTTGSVSGPGFSTITFSVTANAITTVNLPASLGAHTNDAVESDGIHVVALDEVTVYGLNRATATTDAYLGLPTDVLGTSYMILSYSNSFTHNGVEFGVVASENGTTVTITPSVTTMGHSAGVSYTKTLNAGQTYELTNYAVGADLTGTTVTSDKPIGVFGAAACANIPGSVTYCDHICEMLPPVTTLGTKFATVPLKTRNGDSYRFMAVEDGTIISINGVTQSTINKGEFIQKIYSTSAIIESNKPILTCQYSHGTSYDGTPNADPFMMLIPPLEQFLAHYTTATVSGFANHFLNIVVPNSIVSTITIDGSAIGSGNFTAIGSSGYSAAQITVSEASHTIDASLPFGVFSYGYNPYDSYGYTGGQSFSPVATVTALSLTPATGSSQINTNECFEATVTDQNGDPVADVKVDFDISGPNSSQSGFAITNSSGIATFCYAGANGGDDEITAHIGAIGDVSNFTWSTCTEPKFESCPDDFTLYSNEDCEALLDFTPTTTGTGPQTITYVITGATNTSGVDALVDQVFYQGRSFVTFTTVNDCGTDECTFEVFVSDTIRPVLVCSNTAANNDLNECGAYVSVPTPTVSDNCTNSFGTTTELVKNGDFSAQNTNWGDCGNTVEAQYPSEVDYGGSDANNRVAEIDGEPVSLCQTVSGFTVGRKYKLTFRATRRTQSPTPSTVSANVVVDGGALNTSVSRSNTTWDWTTESFTFIASQTSHNITLTPNGISGTYGLMVDDISIKECAGTLVNDYTGTSDASGDYPVGTTVVTWTATDYAGNTSTCSSNVVVADNEKPAANCKNLTVYLDANGSASISGTDIDNGSTDNCGVQSVSVSPNSFGCMNEFSIVTNNSWKLSTFTESSGMNSGAHYWDGADSLPLDSTYTVVPTEEQYATTLVPGTKGLAAKDGVRYYRQTFNLSSLSGVEATFLASVDNSVQVYINKKAVALESDDNQSNFNDGKFLRLVIKSSGSNINGGTGYQSFDSYSTANASDIFVVGENEIVLAVANWDNTQNSYQDHGTISFRANITAAGGGTNAVTLTVTDIHGNAATCNATVTVLDTIKPVVTCAAKSITLSEGVASLESSDILNTATDNCLVVSYAVSKADFDCSNIGKNTVTLTATDASGNTGTCDAEVTVVGTIPTVTVDQSLLPAFCQGGKIVLTATPSESVTYAWSNGPTDAIIQVNASGTYTVTVTNTYGCTGTGSSVVTYDQTALLSSYTIIGTKKEVEIEKNSKVETGGVGALGYKGEVEVEDQSTITGSTTFAKAKKVDVESGSTVTNSYSGTALSLSLPNFIYNPYCSDCEDGDDDDDHDKCDNDHREHRDCEHKSCDHKSCKKKGCNHKDCDHGIADVKVKKNVTVTLADSVYGKIHIESGATVIFSSERIYAYEIETQKDVTIKFTGCARVSICGGLKIHENNSFNPDEKSIVVYVSSKVDIKKGSTVNGNIYTMSQFDTKADKNYRNAITGMIIADKVHSHYTTFNWSTVCGNCFSLNNRSSEANQSDESAFRENGKMYLSVYPNPNEGKFNISLNGNATGPLNIEVMSTIGTVVYTTNLSDFNGFAEIPIDISNQAGGIYFVRVSYPGNSEVIKITNIR